MVAEPTPIHRRSGPQPGVPTPPRHLSAESRRLWRATLARFEFEPHHLTILTVALEALDRLRQAQAEVERDGLTVPGRWGPRAHPAIAIERDARIAYVRAIRELGLDLEPPPERKSWR
ncbi:MAG TPA: P27 family phage terminase small subunit [Candidatus Limnocylindrales bacterium]|nr:P27 family phage terminase small subunit [Candidatus Limnocylindrales bacterium]